MTDNDWSEHYIKRGDPTKPTYYIIRRRAKTTGLLGRYALYAGRIWYALSNGWIPVIDMQNYPSPYLAPEKLGKENAWEYYFEQPLRIGLEQAYSGENVILSDTEDRLPRPSTSMQYYENKGGILTEWRMLRKLGLLKIKPAIYKDIAATREKLFSPKDRVLGVILRGTYYVGDKPNGHAIPPPIELAVSTVVAKIQEWQCNKIFLATEDKNFVEIFKDIFKEFCVVLDREYFEYIPGKKDPYHVERPNDHFLQGKEYLTQIVIASECNSLVAARCGASYTAMMLTDKFEHTYFFNLGRYGVISLD